MAHPSDIKVQAQSLYIGIYLDQVRCETTWLLNVKGLYSTAQLIYCKTTCPLCNAWGELTILPFVRVIAIFNRLITYKEIGDGFEKFYMTCLWSKSNYKTNIPFGAVFKVIYTRKKTDFVSIWSSLSRSIVTSPWYQASRSGLWQMFWIFTLQKTKSITDTLDLFKLVHKLLSSSG